MNLNDLLFLGGVALLLGGIAAFSIPLACIVGGLLFIVIAVGASAAEGGKRR